MYIYLQAYIRSFECPVTWNISSFANYANAGVTIHSPPVKFPLSQPSLGVSDFTGVIDYIIMTRDWSLCVQVDDRWRGGDAVEAGRHAAVFKHRRGRRTVSIIKHAMYSSVILQ